MNLKNIFQSAASGKTAPLLLAAVILSGCASTPTIYAEETLQDNCTILRELKANREGMISEHYRQITDIPNNCKNYQLLAVMAAQEVKNKAYYPMATNASLILLGEMEPPIKAAFIKTLTKANVTIEDLEATKKAATPECRKIDQPPLKSAEPGTKTINFICQ